MELIIAEKPSVGRTIAAVLGVTETKDGYMQGKGMIVTWCIGHLVELAMPEEYNKDYAHWRQKDLPIIPDQWKYTVSKDSAKQFQIVTALMNDDQVHGIICATDAGREGELIFRLVYQMAGCRKAVRRLWISSMEEEAIRDGFRSMKPMAAYDNLYAAALCRAQADWLIGMNATRHYSLLYGPTLHIGRVMTPTLAMLAQREAAIENFEPETFYTVKLDLGHGVIAHSERMKDLNQARTLMDACNQDSAVIRRVEHKQRTENPPLLYDLTTLQRDANRYLGYTALPFAAGLEIAGQTGRVINDQKVSDHHAMIPTAAMPTSGSEISALIQDIRELLYLVSVRLLCALDSPCVYDETMITVECARAEFTIKGKQIAQMGWQRIWQAFRGSLAGRVSKEETEALAAIPDGITEGTVFTTPRAELTEGKTTPPVHHSEDTILHAMETAGVENMPEDAEHKGIGTPATRATILEKLLETKLVERTGERRKRVLIPTTKGIALASVLPERLCSAQLTADWEHRLKRIERGEEKASDFMRDIEAYVRELTQDNTRADKADSLFMPMRQKICACPKCGAAITDRPKGFMCENRVCGFALWKNGGIMKGAEHPLTAGDVKELIEKGSIVKKGLLSSKSHIKYDATLHLDYREDGSAFLRPTFD